MKAEKIPMVQTQLVQFLDQWAMVACSSCCVIWVVHHGSGHISCVDVVTQKAFHAVTWQYCVGEPWPFIVIRYM